MDRDLDLFPDMEAPDVYDLIVVGAGISGALLACESAKAGKRVCVIDKARGSGGRLSAKRVELCDSANQTNREKHWLGFDLGCSDFELTYPETKLFADEWESGNLVSNLGEGIYQPNKRSSFLTRSLVSDVDKKFATKITRIERNQDAWYCFAQEEGCEQLVASASKMVLALPAPQVAALISTGPYKLPIKSVQYSPQWVVMVTLDKSIALDELEDEVFFNGDIAAITCESVKAGRDSHEGLQTWVIHFSHQWTHKYIDWPKESIEEHVGALISRVGSIASIYAHRWLYSQLLNGLHTTSGTLQVDSNLYAVGDWLLKKGQSSSLGGVETAILSAHRLISELNSRTS